MATFTSDADLNIDWFGHSLVGAAGATHRISDSLYEEFLAQFGDTIPGLTWISTNETPSVPFAQTDVTGLTAALAAKYPVTGGTVSGSITATGNIIGAAITATTGRFKGAPWHDARAYGATGDGATNDRTTLQAALDAASAGGTVFIPAGTYAVSGGALTVPSGVTVLGEKGRTIIAASQTNAVFYAAGSLGSLLSINGNVARGDGTVTLATAASAFAEDDIFWLQSEDDALEASGHKKAELGVVASSSGSTITVAGRIFDSYLTASTSRLAEVTPVRGVHFRDLTIRNAMYSATTTPTSPLILLDFAVGASVVGCHLYQNNGAGIDLRNCLNAVVSGNVIERLRDNAGSSVLGYGVVVSYASRNVSITGNTLRRCRHAITTDTSNAGSTPNYGVQRGLTISGNAVADTTQAAIDTHEDVDGAVISGNSIVGCDEVGIQYRGYNGVIDGNVIHNIRGIGIYIRPTGKNVVVSSNLVFAVGISPSSANGDGILVDTTNVSLTGNRVQECARHGYYLGTSAIRDILVVGNAAIDNAVVTAADGFYVDAAATRLLFNGNIATDTRTAKTQRYGLAFTATVTESHRIALVGNIFSDNATDSFNNAGSGTPMTVGNTPRDMSGFEQRIKQSTGTVAANTTSSIAVTWPGTFSDTDYAVQAIVEESNGDMEVLCLLSKTATTATFRVRNNSGASTRTGTLHVRGVHD